MPLGRGRTLPVTSSTNSACTFSAIGKNSLLSGSITTCAMPVRSRRRLFSQGVIVSILNPKLALFFVAFLPQFVDRAHGNVRLQLLVFGLLFEAIALITDSSYALLAGTMGRALRNRKRYARTERYVAGGIYIALGAAAAATGSNRK